MNIADITEPQPEEPSVPVNEPSEPVESPDTKMVNLPGDKTHPPASGIIETIYINNLNDRISLNKLKPKLTEVFSGCGNIIQITAHRNLKMKGQAFVTFDSKDASQRAREKFQNYNLFGKQMHIDYAKSNSDNYFLQTVKDLAAVELRKQAKAQHQNERLKVAKPSTKKLQSWKNIPPNKVLLLQNLADEVNKESLMEFFEEFSGFINVRHVKIRNLAFVEFDSENAATKCLGRNQGENLKKFGEVILTYAKK